MGSKTTIDRVISGMLSGEELDLFGFIIQRAGARKWFVRCRGEPPREVSGSPKKLLADLKAEYAERCKGIA